LGLAFRINLRTAAHRRDFPICVAKDRFVTVALQWDYAAWTPRPARFTDAVQNVDAQAAANNNG